jgi:hypothetical protein
MSPLRAGSVQRAQRLKLAAPMDVIDAWKKSIREEKP